MLKHQIIGQKILKVTYFELNDSNPPFYFEGFDNFDLGLDIELSNGFSFHIGWTENDRHEIGTGKYIPIERLNPHASLDATVRWSSIINLVIRDIEVIYVSKEWSIPAQCTISFENDDKITIILGGELNLDGSLPLPLKYENMIEIYVFHCLELPPIELVEFILSDYRQDEEHQENIDLVEGTKRIEPNLIGILILFIIAVLTVIKLAFGE